MVRTFLAVVVALIAAAILVVAAWPQLFGLQDAPIIAQVVSLRGLDIAIAIALILVLLLALIWWRRGRRFLTVLIGMLAVFALASAGILAVRGFGGDTPAAHGGVHVTE